MEHHLYEPLMPDGGSAVEQKERESDACTRGKLRQGMKVSRLVAAGMGDKTPAGRRYDLHWLPTMVDAVSAIVPNKLTNLGVSTMLVHSIGTSECCERAIAVVLSRLMEYSAISTRRLYYAVGTEVVAVRAVQMLAEHDRTMRESGIKPYQPLLLKLKRSRDYADARKAIKWTARSLGAAIDLRGTVVEGVGRVLVDNLVTTAAAGRYGHEFEPALEIVQLGPRMRVVRFTRAAESRIAEMQESACSVKPIYEPMTRPPVPWTQERRGGYMTIPTPFFGNLSNDQAAAFERCDMTTAMEAKNYLDEMAWTVFPDVVRLIRQHRDMGGDNDHVVPAKMLAWPDPLPPGSTDDEKAEYRRVCAEIYAKNRERRSKAFDIERALTVADKFTGHDRIYFPHINDFRGRYYCLPEGLNFQRNDPCRAMLLFAHRQPINDRGRWWLKVHCANLAGQDKRGFQDRVAWTEQNMGVIREVAESPLGHPLWEAAGKDRWQFYVACRAMFDDDVAERLPVQIDGSCNGFQHYAAMMRDTLTAKRVNLMPSDAPHDIYSDVLDMARSILSERGGPVVEQLMPLLTRKIVKRPVMTTVYGVTQYGARDQIGDELAAAGVKDWTMRMRMSSVLVDALLKCTIELCPAVGAAMGWLRSAARAHFKEHKSVPIDWVSPCGLNIVQTYYKTRGSTGSRGKRRRDKSKIDGRRSAQALPPNLIHSIDASHLAFSVIASYDRGVLLSCVHDCFSSHASSMDTVSEVLREQMVMMHSNYTWENVVRDITRNISGKIPEPPAPGDFDLSNIIGAHYSFS